MPGFGVFGSLWHGQYAGLATTLLDGLECIVREDLWVGTLMLGVYLHPATRDKLWRGGLICGPVFSAVHSD